jgi:hypothetical protein
MRARLQEGSQKEATPLDKARKEVAAAIDAGKLDEAFVDKAANAGQRDTVVLSLSALAKVPEAIVRKIIQSGSAKPVIALVWHAGLSMRVAFKIQSFVMKLTASELLPARAGVHFPMTEDEMRWHLSYFDVDL